MDVPDVFAVDFEHRGNLLGSQDSTSQERSDHFFPTLLDPFLYALPMLSVLSIPLKKEALFLKTQVESTDLGRNPFIPGPIPLLLFFSTPVPRPSPPLY